MQARKDALTSGKIETGLVFEQMLGPEDARSYLRAEGVPDATIERVLSGVFRRPDAAKTQTGVGDGFYASSGRRKDVVRSCIVQAALALRGQLGNERIARMLRREQLPEAVIERVMQGEAGTLRARPAALAPKPPGDQVKPPPVASRPSA